MKINRASVNQRNGVANDLCFGHKLLTLMIVLWREDRRTVTEPYIHTWSSSESEKDNMCDSERGQVTEEEALVGHT